MNRPELRPLTSIRGLFAWAVVLYHIRLAMLGWLPIGVIQVLAKGYLAVDFFFLLSGFVIWLNYAERLRTPGKAADFLIRRLARVWPLHAIMLTFAATIAGLLIATGRAADHFPFALLPLHMAMMQDWGLSNALMWNDPAWSISAEWAAYLLLPIAVLVLPTWRVPTPMLAVATTLPLLALAAVLHGAGALALGFDISHYGVVRCLTEFACGTMLCALWRRWRGNTRAEIGAWIASSFALGGWAVGTPEILTVPFAFATLLLALALGAERAHHPLSGRFIHWLGEISYATYLSHFLLFFAFKLAFVSDARNVSPALICLFLLIVLGTSALLYYGVERTAQRTILRGWAARQRPIFNPVRST